MVAIGSIFTLARFSEAFLVLRAQQMEIPLFTIPLVMVAMNLVYSVTAYPFGKLSDSMSHSKLLQWGLLVLILADIVLALSGHWSTLLVGVALWGIHMGMTQGLLAAMVAHTAPPELRGTAFGMFNLMSGGAVAGQYLRRSAVGNLRRRFDVLRWRDNLRGHDHRHARYALSLSSGLKTAPGPDQLFHRDGESPGARRLLLPVVGVRPVFTQKMFFHQPAINRLQLRINAAGNPRHARHLFHHYRVVHRLVGVFPRENGPC